MGTRAELVFAVLACVVILFIAFKVGAIGGGGAGASRDKNPILFWMGVSTTALFGFIAVLMLVMTFI